MPSAHRAHIELMALNLPVLGVYSSTEVSATKKHEEPRERSPVFGPTVAPGDQVRDCPGEASQCDRP